MDDSADRLQSGPIGRKPLAGVRVLDFSRILAGPYCAQLLGDLGADVVKVELPGTGDPLRRQGPPFVHGNGISFYAANRNKRSIALDLKSDGGRRIAKQLCGKADVLLENFRPGVMDRLGLGYEALSLDNPRLVYASISGFGADGPDSGKRAYDLTIQAIGGYMNITGQRNGEPVKLGTSGFDVLAGTNCYAGILAALLQRGMTGVGQKVETSLLESQVAFLVGAALEYLLVGTEPEKWGSEHAQQVPYKAFKTADGWAVIAAGFENLYPEFCKVLGREDLARDVRFRTMADRVENRELLYGILDSEVARHASRELLAALEAAGVPCAPINNMEQVFSDAQVLHRHMKQTLQHPEYGEVASLGAAVKFSEFDVAGGWKAPPLVGEHTAQVLREWLGIGPSVTEHADTQ
ncbi:MAG TPA: CoA transferase [Castellaniella sp.]|uniref:CaiB/BaiF CoA transferase family protein n=1 Tax=Castellaniella sp. TaxID=1955812 RepID=UPI002F120674